MNIVCIPARYASSRLPKKALAKLGDESLIEHVYKRCVQSKLADKVYVLTDHQAIFDEVKRFSDDVVMTDSSLPSGTDRVCAGAGIIGANDDDFIINVQGDQAFMDSALIDELITAYNHCEDKEQIAVFTLMNRVKNFEDLDNPGDVKIALDKNNKALYFSRSVIPYIRDNDMSKSQVPYFKHLGIYGYRYAFLKKYVSFPVGVLEQVEQLEQLRVLENGYAIEVVETDKTTMEINYPQDLKEAMARLGL